MCILYMHKHTRPGADQTNPALRHTTDTHVHLTHCSVPMLTVMLPNSKHCRLTGALTNYLPCLAPPVAKITGSFRDQAIKS